MILADHPEQARTAGRRIAESLAPIIAVFRELARRVAEALAPLAQYAARMRRSAPADPRARCICPPQHTAQLATVVADQDRDESPLGWSST